MRLLLLTLLPLLARAQDWTDRAEYDLALAVRAQSSADVVRGRVIDKETGKPIAGATVDYHPLGGNQFVVTVRLRFLVSGSIPARQSWMTSTKSQSTYSSLSCRADNCLKLRTS